MKSVDIKGEIMSFSVRIKKNSEYITVGEGVPIQVIAEIGLNHNGRYELASELIEAAAAAGADFVKFQKRSPADLATAAFLDSPFAKCPDLGKTQREVRERLELSMKEYQGLKKYAEDLGMGFFASAFDIPSVDFLNELGVSVVKIASHSITNGPLLEKIAGLRLPVICSLGGVTEQEADNAIKILRDNPLVIMHCISSYPTHDHLMNLDTITYYKNRYEVPVGFSSHEEGIDFSVAAATLGAVMIERHFTLDKSMVGLDQSISLLPEEFREMAGRIKRIQHGRGTANKLLPEERAAKSNYHVAVCSVNFIPKGTVLTEGLITCKQPLKDSDIFFTGLEFNSVVGKTVMFDIEGDSPIARSDVG